MASKSIILICLLYSAHSILLELTPDTHSKCYLAELSPDKTLEAKFGILRNTKEQCGVRFTIAIVESEGQEQREVIHDKEYTCYQTRSNDPIVVKHTSPQLDYDGKYQLCVEALDIRSPTLLVQLFMGQKLNPALYHNQLGQLPLVQSAELLQLQQKVQVIKRVLVKLQGKTSRSKEQGQKFDGHIDQIVDGSKLIALIHIVLVVIFGAVWVYLFKQLKIQH